MRCRLAACRLSHRLARYQNRNPPATPPRSGLKLFTSQKMQTIFQVAAWLLVLAIVVLSVGPPSTRPITGAGHALEHLSIFLATGLAFALGYPRRFWSLCLPLLAFTAAIEVAQTLIPGRHARVNDFLLDATASCFGVGLSYLLGLFRAATIQD